MLVAVSAGCQITSSPTPTPPPSPTPHIPVTSAILQAADVPADLQSCPGSGPIAAYLSNLQTNNPVLAQNVSAQWRSLQQAGAQEAAISLFTSDPSACSAELGADGGAKAAASFVAAFADEGQADRAWETGLLGFVPPAPGELPPGVVRGTSTGLGPSSWTYGRTPVRLASWRRIIFVALVVLTNLDSDAFKTATAAVDARIH
jgi:hypothetical protein